MALRTARSRSLRNSGVAKEPPVLPTSFIALTVREDALFGTQVAPLPNVISDATEDRLDVDVDDPSIPEGQVPKTMK